MCVECLEKHSKKEKLRARRYRMLCIENYGGSCVCCGNSNYKYLQLDHINNDGAEHRKKLSNGKRGGNMYRWAVSNDYPKNLQLLCANCHHAKTYFGGCSKEDHEKDSTNVTLQISENISLSLE